MLRRILGCCLAVLIGCAPAQQIQPAAQVVAPVTPTVSHVAASGCVGDHDALDFGPGGGSIDAYPAWPPNGTPDHLVIHYSNGDTIWGKPSYGAANCQDYAHCQRATFTINPTWKQCIAVGQLLEVVTLDGMPVLESSLLQITEPQTSRTVYLGLSRGAWYAGPSVTAVVAQAQQAANQQAAQSNTASGSSAVASGAQAFGAAVGVALSAALALGVVYLAAREQNLNYQAQVQQENLNYMAVTKPVNCSSTWVGSYWQTTATDDKRKMGGKGAWRVASYEIDMHETLSKGQLSSPTAIGNALTESIVLHARQLCEMFLSRSTPADNVKMTDLIPEADQSERLRELLAELEREYGNRRTKESPCWVFNKMLLHPTKERLDGYNYDTALNRVRPVLKKIIAEIENKRGLFDRRLRS